MSHTTSDHLLANALADVRDAAKVCGQLAESVRTGSVEQRIAAAAAIEQNGAKLLQATGAVRNMAQFRAVRPESYSGTLPEVPRD